jgi:hypothetical protein
MVDAYLSRLPLAETQRRVERSRLGHEVPQSSLRSGILHLVPDTYQRQGRGTY